MFGFSGERLYGERCAVGGVQLWVPKVTNRPISQEFFFIPKIEKRPETRENAVSQEFQNNSKQFQNSKMSSKRETPPPPLPPRFGHPCNIKFTQPCVRSLNSDPLGRRRNKFTCGGRCKRFGQTRQRAGTGLWGHAVALLGNPWPVNLQR